MRKGGGRKMRSVRRDGADRGAQDFFTFFQTGRSRSATEIDNISKHFTLNFRTPYSSMTTPTRYSWTNGISTQQWAR